ncbi:MAG: hypothetical protein V4754_03655 [Pseudomonadota bacterium]
MKRPAARGAFWRIWGWPLTVGTLSLAGLIGALVGEGWWDHLCALALATPLLAAAWFGRRRTTARQGGDGAD